jgi:hypothetical protein
MAATTVINQATGHAHTASATAMKYRSTNSGSPLSHQDVDDNFELLRQAVNGVIGDIDGVVDKNLTSDLSNAQLGYAENSKNYPVELGKNSGESSNTRMYVNVPWANTTYSTATSSALGLVRTLSTAEANNLASKNYPVQLNNNGQMYVAVPWVDTNTNTWNANSKTVAGYVSAPGSTNTNKVWKTDSSGNPGWRSDSSSSFSFNSGTGVLTITTT